MKLSSYQKGDYVHERFIFGGAGESVLIEMQWVLKIARGEVCSL